MRALDAIAQGGGETWAMGTVGLPPSDGGLGRYDLAALIREAIEQTAARKNVVIVAHAASHVTAHSADALWALVTASPDTRAKRLAELEGIAATGRIAGRIRRSWGRKGEARRSNLRLRSSHVGLSLLRR